MEKLATQPILLRREGRTEEYQLQEKDHGDMVVYDLFSKSCYLMTIGRDGSILFINFEAPAAEREVFNISFLQQVGEAIRNK